MLLDGTPVRAASWGLVTPIDRGSHELVATAPGKTRWTSVVLVPNDGVSVRTEVPALVDAPVAGPAGPPVVDKPAAGMGVRVFAGWSSVALGGAFVVTGSILGGFAIDRRMQSDAECPNEHCTQRGVDLNEHAKTFAWLANVGIGLGILGVGAGIILLVTVPKKVAVQVVPMVTATAGGLGAFGTF